MLSERDLRRVLATLPLTDAPGPWFRFLLYRYLQGPPPGAPPGSAPQPLWPGGPPLVGARFTPRGGFDTVYLALDQDTAADEGRGVIRRPAGVPALVRIEPWVLLTVEGVVQRVLDVTDRDVQAALATSLMELTGDWQSLQEAGILPETQRLGRVAYELDIAGIVYNSAMNRRGGRCIAIFPDVVRRFGLGHLEVFDPSGTLRDRLP